MERASPHHNKHDNKAVSRPARRGPVCLAAQVLLALGIFGFSAAAFPSPVHWQHPSGQAPAHNNKLKLAEKDVQIGQFYLKIGKYDASISRFQEALAHDPSWAVPHEWLGEAFEKKNDPERALAEYREYLKKDPHAKDARKIRQRMEKLARDLRDRKQQPAGGNRSRLAGARTPPAIG
ncbi:MAG TPA: tetratricopeptide repeat protein [Candidatus Dormibacteraeota bacterium]|nr:tetratricopeptide repeat protein [Candidatus Dormibacteraeota bacterium]